MIGFYQTVYQVSESEQFLNACVEIYNDPPGSTVIPVQIEVEFEAKAFMEYRAGMCYIMVILYLLMWFQGIITTKKM